MCVAIVDNNSKDIISDVLIYHKATPYIEHIFCMKILLLLRPLSGQNSSSAIGLIPVFDIQEREAVRNIYLYDILFVVKINPFLGSS